MKNLLLKSPFTSSILLMILYYIFMIGATFIVRILFSSFPYVFFALINFSVIFGFLAILWLFIVPYGFNFPNEPVIFKEYLEEIKLDKSTFKPIKIVILASIAWIALMFLVGLGMSFLIGRNIYDPNRLFNVPTSSNPAWLAFIFALTPGIWEEIAFRGVILSIYEKKHPDDEFTVLLMNGILFGIFHFGNLLLGAGLFVTIIQVIFATLMGIYFSIIVKKTKKLYPAILTHYLFDVIFFLSLYNLYF